MYVTVSLCPAAPHLTVNFQWHTFYTSTHYIFTLVYNVTFLISVSSVYFDVNQLVHSYQQKFI